MNIGFQIGLTGAVLLPVLGFLVSVLPSIERHRAFLLLNATALVSTICGFAFGVLLWIWA